MRYSTPTARFAVVEHDPGGQRVELDDQPVGMARRHVEHALAAADPAVTVGGERREADPFGGVVDPVESLGSAALSTSQRSRCQRSLPSSAISRTEVASISMKSSSRSAARGDRLLGR